MTIPRLELNGELIVDRLLSYVEQVLKYRIQGTICSTESSAALHWNRGLPGQCKQYVANRANEVTASVMTTRQIHHLEESLQLPLYLAITGGMVQAGFLSQNANGPQT